MMHTGAYFGLAIFGFLIIFKKKEQEQIRAFLKISGLSSVVWYIN
jgi:predicted membrane-bound mannosyltransferase